MDDLKLNARNDNQLYLLTQTVTGGTSARTNYVKATIESSQADPRCRIYNQSYKTISKMNRNESGKSIVTCQETLGLSEMRSGMTMFLTVYLKMSAASCCVISL